VVIIVTCTEVIQTRTTSIDAKLKYRISNKNGVNKNVNLRHCDITVMTHCITLLLSVIYIMLMDMWLITTLLLSQEAVTMNEATGSENQRSIK